MLAACALLAAPAGAELCGLMTCGPPTLTPPTVSFTPGDDATFSANVNPENASTTYQFSLGDGVTSPTDSLPANSDPSTASWSVPDLSPGTRYVVVLSARNEYGDAEASTAFTAPLLPAPPTTLKIPREVSLGFDEFAAYLGPAAPYMHATLQIAYAPAWRFRTAANTVSSETGEVAFPAIADGLGLAQNARVRMVLDGYSEEGGQTHQPATGRATFVYVLPEVVATLQPARYNFATRQYVYNGEWRFGFQARLTPGLSRSYRGPVTYVYLGTGRHGPFRRISQRIRWQSEASGSEVSYPFEPGLASASGTFHDAHLHGPAPWYLVCTRTPLRENMGPRFHFPSCGRNVLSVGGPEASETILRAGVAVPLR
jgi:hypothetical protein